MKNQKKKSFPRRVFLCLLAVLLAVSTPFSFAMARAFAAPARNSRSTLMPSLFVTTPCTISAGHRGVGRPPKISGQTGTT